MSPKIKQALGTALYAVSAFIYLAIYAGIVLTLIAQLMKVIGVDDNG